MSRQARRTSPRRVKRRARRPAEPGGFPGLDEPQPVTYGLSPNQKMFYTKVICGAIFGIAIGIGIFLNLIPNETWWILGIGGLIISMLIVRNVLKIDQDLIDMKRLILAGTFTFTITYLVGISMTWMLLYL